MLSGNTFRKDQKRIGSDVIYPWLSAFFSKCLQHERLKQPAVKCSEVPRKNCSSAAVRSHCIAKVPCRECFLHHFCPGRWNGLWMGWNMYGRLWWEFEIGSLKKPYKALIGWQVCLHVCWLWSTSWNSSRQGVYKEQLGFLSLRWNHGVDLCQHLGRFWDGALVCFSPQNSDPAICVQKKSGVVQMCLFSRLYNSYTCFASICQVYQIQRHQHCCKSKAAARLDHSKHSLSAHDDHDVTDSEPLHWFWGSGGFQ